MLWNKARRSTNVNDTREGKDARKPTGLVLGAGLAFALTGAGVYTALSPTQETPSEQNTSRFPVPAVDPQLTFVQAVLGDTEDTWKDLFAQTGKHYPEPTLTLFGNGVNSGCGYVGSGGGPFYCPTNKQIYLDLEFFKIMAERYSVVGDFAQAYIIAHEVGHHVQLELGLSEPLEKALNEDRPVTGDGGLEVRGELQADCLAGVWAHHAQNRHEWLEPGDIDDALNAASTFGDDYLQAARKGTVLPETFSHGTSQQRQHWFTQGFTVGTIDACDTFTAETL
jgi:predicted metalloprotease